MSNFLVNIYVKMDCWFQQCPWQTRVGNFSILHFALLDFGGVTWFPFIQISHILHKTEGMWGEGGGRERNEMYRRVFSNQSNSYNGALCKQSTIFAKKAPLQIFDWVLNTPLLYQIWILMKGKKDFQQWFC